MRLEKIIIRHGKAKTIKEAQEHLRDIRSKCGSDEDYYNELKKVYNIVKHPSNPKRKRRRLRIAGQLIVSAVTFFFLMICLINKYFFLAWVLLVLGVSCVLIFDWIEEDLNRNTKN